MGGNQDRDALLLGLCFFGLRLALLLWGCNQMFTRKKKMRNVCEITSATCRLNGIIMHSANLIGGNNGFFFLPLFFRAY